MNLEQILKCIESLSRQDRDQLVGQLLDTTDQNLADSLKIETLLTRPSASKEGRTTFQLSITNQAHIRYYITEISFSSPSHTGLRYQYMETIKPLKSKSFYVDVFEDDDEEVKFLVSGFPMPGGFKILPEVVATHKTY